MISRSYEWMCANCAGSLAFGWPGPRLAGDPGPRGPYRPRPWGQAGPAPTHARAILQAWCDLQGGAELGVGATQRGRNWRRAASRRQVLYRTLTKRTNERIRTTLYRQATRATRQR